MRLVAVLAALVQGVAPALAAVPSPIHLASTRAVYDVALERTSGGDVVAARGRMAIDFRDVCDGWSTTQRLVADLTGSDGTPTRTDFFVTAWESRDGRTMRFDIADRRDGKTTSRQRGSAALDPDGAGHVTLVAGKPHEFSLPRGTQFPTAQILSILNAAEAGATTQRHIVFQGGDRSDLNFSTALIGHALPDAALAAARSAGRGSVMRGVPAWPVLTSFFPLAARAEEPDYEVATQLFANGVNGSMSLIYPTYTLRATLTRVESLPPRC
jgi:hypothetical protein